jgi:hypothetical protein
MSNVKVFWYDKLRSTEFWLSLLSILLGGLIGAGFIGDQTIYAKIGGWALAALASAGYTTGRTLAKAADGAGRAGFKTTEFWKAILAAVLVWVQSHALPDGSRWAELVGMVLSLLPVGSYIVARGALKGPGPLLVAQGMLESTPATPASGHSAVGGTSKEG